MSGCALLAANRGIEEIFDYCFTTIGTIYSIECVFATAIYSICKNVFYFVCLRWAEFLRAGMKVL